MEFLTSALGWFTSNLAGVLQVIGVFSVVATMTKNKSDDKIVQLILDGVNFLGANLGNAKNDPSK